MNTERIKSFILFSLVIMSFVLTTLIWFNISIKGLFVMPPKDEQAFKQLTASEKESLLKPNKLVVHIGENHTLLFNNQGDKEYYNGVLKDSNEIIRDLLNNKENYTVSSIGIDQLQNIREGIAVELIFKSTTELDYIKGLLDVQKNLWNDVKQVNSIIISPAYNRIYIVDKSKAIIHQFTAIRMSNALENIIAEIKYREDFAYVFLNDFNKENLHLYGEYAIAPVSIASMPVLTIKKEVETDTKPSTEIARFFNDDKSDESDKINNGIRDTDGTVTFTDRKEKTVRIDTNGVLEYYKYNITSEDIKYTDMKEAIDIAADYVNQHLEFTGDFYLSDIESTLQGGRPAYIIRFDYKYNGIPIITEAESSKSAIEVEIVGQEVKRYKRNVREVVKVEKTVAIKTFNEILDIVQGGLNERLNVTKSESITKINDLYLAYIERNEALIPVWVVDVDVESSVRDIKITNNKKYFIGAEEGAILVEQ